MADDIQTLGKLLIQTIKVMRKLEKDYTKDPVKNFDYVARMRDNFEKIGELNGKEEIFEEERDYSEFLEQLGKFIDVTDDYRTKEESPYRETLNIEKVLRVLVDLDKRYDTLAEKQ